MAKLDFPGSPSANQKYPSPAVAGQPVYTWDGEKWTSIASQYVPGTAPFEPAMAYSGMQINGGMEVSQEKGGTTAAITYAQYICDGWKFAGNATGPAFSAQAAIGANLVPGIPAMLAVYVTTAKASLAAADFVSVVQMLEGYRVARLAWGTAFASPLTIGFWSDHHRTGVYSISIQNAANDRSCAVTYIQTTADTPQYQVVTFPGCPDGTWSKDNTTSIQLHFSMAIGTTYAAPTTSVWYSTTYVAAAGQINSVAATSDIFRITGVTVLPGTQAPTAAQSPNIMRPYGEELVTCQRYYWKYKAAASEAFCIASIQQTTVAVGPVRYPAVMRAVPTTSVSGSWVFNQAAAQVAMTGIGTTYAGVAAAEIYGVIPANTQGLSGRIQAGDATATFVADARL